MTVVDKTCCALVANRLRELDLQLKTYAAVESSLPELTLPQLREYYFFLCTLLFDFRGISATLDGQAYHGSDLFFALARRQVKQDAETFSAQRLATVTTEDLNRIFSLEGDATHPLIGRGDERAKLLRETATALMQKYDGSLEKLLAECGGYLRRDDGKGLLDVLASLAGYRDPHLKKAFVLLKIWQRLGLWEAKDKQNLFIPVDYHLLRVALRTGIVQVSDGALLQCLRQKMPVTDDEEDEIRSAVKWAYKRVEELSGIDVFVLDEIFWTIGRSCCHYARPARCEQCDFTQCSVSSSFHYDCPGRCPLSEVCAGSQDLSYRALFEPMVKTIYY